MTAFNPYISKETLNSPASFSYYAIAPYKEGWYNIKNCGLTDLFKKKSGISDRLKTLSQITCHLFVGALLFVPVINTIALTILSACFTEQIQARPAPVFPDSDTEDEDPPLNNESEEDDLPFEDDYNRLSARLTEQIRARPAPVSDIDTEDEDPPLNIDSEDDDSSLGGSDNNIAVSKTPLQPSLPDPTSTITPSPSSHKFVVPTDLRIKEAMKKNPLTKALMVVTACIDKMNTMNLEEGLFRLPGSIEVVNSWVKTVYEKKKLTSTSKIFLELSKETDINNIANLMKKILNPGRALKEYSGLQLKPKEYECITKVFVDFKELTPTKRVENTLIYIAALRDALKALPDDKRNLFEVVLFYLHCLLKKSEITKMNSENLATVWSPTLINVSGQTNQEYISNLGKHAYITKLMIENAPQLF